MHLQSPTTHIEFTNPLASNGTIRRLNQVRFSNRLSLSHALAHISPFWHLWNANYSRTRLHESVTRLYQYHSFKFRRYSTYANETIHPYCQIKQWASYQFSDCLLTHSSRLLTAFRTMHKIKSVLTHLRHYTHSLLAIIRSNPHHSTFNFTRD